MHTQMYKGKQIMNSGSVKVSAIVLLMINIQRQSGSCVYYFCQRLEVDVSGSHRVLMGESLESFQVYINLGFD